MMSPHDVPSDEELGLEPRSEFVPFPCGCILEVPDEADGHDPEECLERQDEERRWFLEQEQSDARALPEEP
jgi:hypothetical protein